MVGVRDRCSCLQLYTRKSQKEIPRCFVAHSNLSKPAFKQSFYQILQTSNCLKEDKKELLPLQKFIGNLYNKTSIFFNSENVSFFPWHLHSDHVMKTTGFLIWELFHLVT